MGAKTSRREFLKNMALAGAGVAGLPHLVLGADEPKPARAGKARVVVATRDNLIEGENVISAAAVQAALAACMIKLTKTRSQEAAWKSLFSSKDVVGIKVNGLFGKGVASHPEVAMAVAKGLQMAGVKPENIIIWDRATGDLIKSGYTPSRDGKGVQCYGEDGDWGQSIEQGSFKGRISKILSEKVTAYVNVPILKTHGGAGISCCLKNHYGSFDNPGSHHGDYCNPAMADFSAIPQVKQKTRLVVVDAIRPQYEGGPGLNADAQWSYLSLMASLDPVAADTVGLGIINEYRNKMGKGNVPENMTKWLQSAQDRGVGICDKTRIEVIKA